MPTVDVAIYGASGYTGAELVRLLSQHPHARITALSADSNAGRSMADVFPQFTPYDLPTLQKLDDVDLTAVDVLFCALPHGTTQMALKAALTAKPGLKVVDLSADFRLSDPDSYARWYGDVHSAPDLQQEAVYGLVEVHRRAIAGARLVGNPGCYTTTALLALVPLAADGVIDPETIVIDAKSGVTGAGRAAKVGMLFAEVTEGFHAYGVGGHRHTAELDQELSRAVGRAVAPTFTPHLVPMNRGIYATIYAAGDAGAVHGTLADHYRDERFVTVLPLGTVPQSRHVRGSNLTHIGVVPDRRSGRCIIIATLDNLVKGASGQAIQNMNVMCGFDEGAGLGQLALFP